MKCLKKVSLKSVKKSEPKFDPVSSFYYLTQQNTPNFRKLPSKQPRQELVTSRINCELNCRFFPPHTTQLGVESFPNLKGGSLFPLAKKKKVCTNILFATKCLCVCVSSKGFLFSVRISEKLRKQTFDTQLSFRRSTEPTERRFQRVMNSVKLRLVFGTSCVVSTNC